MKILSEESNMLWQYREVDYQSRRPVSEWTNTTKSFTKRNLAPAAKHYHVKIADWLNTLEQHPGAIASTLVRQYRSIRPSTQGETE